MATAEEPPRRRASPGAGRHRWLLPLPSGYQFVKGLLVYTGASD